MSEKELLLEKLKELYPEYEKASRGRGRIKQINDIPSDKRKKFLLYEEKLKLLNNRVAAKNARKKKKLYLESLEEKVMNLERKIKIQEKEIKILRSKIVLLKRKNEKLNSFSNTKPSNANPPSILTPSPPPSIPSPELFPSFDEIIKFDEIDYSLDLEIF